MAVKIREGDEVFVIAGNDRGRKGTVMEIDRKTGRAYVEGINVGIAHRKPSEGRAGARVPVTLSVHVSNLAMVDPVEDVPTRVGFRFREDGTKVRYAKKSGETLEDVK